MIDNLAGFLLVIGVVLVAVGCATASIPALIAGAGCMGTPFFARERLTDDRAEDGYHDAWARETARHLPGRPEIATQLAAWVEGTGDFQAIPAPWDESSAEVVERIITDAADRCARRDGMDQPIESDKVMVLPNAATYIPSTTEHRAALRKEHALARAALRKENALARAAHSIAITRAHRALRAQTPRRNSYHACGPRPTKPKPGGAEIC